MTKEEKQLLIIAICDYLPYKPILINKELSGGYPQKVFPGYLGLSMFLDSSKIDNTAIFLRPMSSMTEEEKAELFQLMGNGTDIQRVDFYNAHHFDYRGLIPMGLALEAPKDMYNTKTE